MTYIIFPNISRLTRELSYMVHPLLIEALQSCIVSIEQHCLQDSCTIFRFFCSCTPNRLTARFTESSRAGKVPDWPSVHTQFPAPVLSNC